MFLVRQSEYDGWVARNRGTDTPAQAVMMRLLDMGLTREDEFSEVKQLLGRDGLGLIDDMRVEKVQSERGSEKEDKNRYYYLSFRPALQPRENPRYFWFDGLSSGTQRLVAIITAMIYDHSAVMLLEHPEDGIHRALLRKLIGVLQAYSGQSQLIIASHSADVFNALDPAAVRLVTMEDGQTGVRKLTAEEVQAAAKYLEEEGSLADFLEIVADD
jgi:ABC-type branched-subunit amino acid transport system ATPase component